MTTPNSADALKHELAACPFCGSKNVKAFAYDAFIGGEPDAYCQCQDCSVTGPNGKTEAEAITAWNRRTVEAQAADVGGLPKLPKPHALNGKALDSLHTLYTADQMHNYARAAILAAGQGAKDSERLDVLEVQRKASLARGFKWDGWHYTTDKPIREQLDAAIAAKGAHGGAE